MDWAYLTHDAAIQCMLHTCSMPVELTGYDKSTQEKAQLDKVPASGTQNVWHCS